MPGDGPLALRFTDVRLVRHQVVADSAGEPVAFIKRGAFGRFGAFTTDGTVLCGGRHRGPLSRYYDMLAADGSALGDIRPAGRYYRIMLLDGRCLQLRNRWFMQGWVVAGDDGAEVLSTVRYAARDRSREDLETGHHPEGSPTFRGHPYVRETYFRTGPDDWLVTPDRSLDLAQTVAITEMYRTIVRAERNRKGGSWLPCHRSRRCALRRPVRYGSGSLVRALGPEGLRRWPLDRSPAAGHDIALTAGIAVVSPPASVPVGLTPAQWTEPATVGRRRLSVRPDE